MAEPASYNLNDEPINFILDGEVDADNARLLEDGNFRLLEDENIRLLE